MVVNKGTGWWHRGVETPMGAVGTSIGALSLRSVDVGVPWGWDPATAVGVMLLGVPLLGSGRPVSVTSQAG